MADPLNILAQAFRNTSQSKLSVGQMLAQLQAKAASDAEARAQEIRLQQMQNDATMERQKEAQSLEKLKSDREQFSSEVDMLLKYGNNKAASDLLGNASPDVVSPSMRNISQGFLPQTRTYQETKLNEPVKLNSPIKPMGLQAGINKMLGSNPFKNTQQSDKPVFRQEAKTETVAPKYNFIGKKSENEIHQSKLDYVRQMYTQGGRAAAIAAANSFGDTDLVNYANTLPKTTREDILDWNKTKFTIGLDEQQNKNAWDTYNDFIGNLSRFNYQPSAAKALGQIAWSRLINANVMSKNAPQPPWEKIAEGGLSIEDKNKLFYDSISNGIAISRLGLDVSEAASEAGAATPPAVTVKPILPPGMNQSGGLPSLGFNNPNGNTGEIRPMPIILPPKPNKTKKTGSVDKMTSSNMDIARNLGFNSQSITNAPAEVLNNIGYMKRAGILDKDGNVRNKDEFERRRNVVNNRYAVKYGGNVSKIYDSIPKDQNNKFMAALIAEGEKGEQGKGPQISAAIKAFIKRYNGNPNLINQYAKAYWSAYKKTRGIQR